MRNSEPRTPADTDQPPDKPPKKNDRDNQPGVADILAVLRESTEAPLEAAQAFALEFVDQYPQKTDATLHYSFAGSLALMLLARADSLELLDGSALPIIKIDPTKVVIGREAGDALTRCARKIGDLDLIKFSEAASHPEPLGKGHIKVNLSDDAQEALKEPQYGVSCDPLEKPDQPRIAKIVVDGKEVFIAEPIEMLAYKVLHIAQSLSRSTKSEAMIKEFKVLLHLARALYPEATIRAEVLRALVSFMPEHPNNSTLPYYHDLCDPSVSSFFDDLVAHDPDSHYLASLIYGKERKIGFLKVLHHYQAAPEKARIADFIGQHQASIDVWEINPQSAKNIEMITNYICEDEERLRSFRDQQRLEAKASREDVAKELRFRIYLIPQYAIALPNQDQLERIPKPSELLNILIVLDNDHRSEAELRLVDKLLAKGINQRQLLSIISHPFLDKTRWLAALQLASEALDPNSFNQLLLKLSTTLNKDMDLDAAQTKWIAISEAERVKKAIQILEAFDINADLP